MVAAPRGEVVAELGSQLPGRGAHCCFDRNCLRLALRPGALAHVLRRKVELPGADVIAGQVLAALENKIRGLLGAGLRKGTIAAGREAALREAGSGKAGRWFFAADLSPGSRKELEERAADPVRLPLRMNEVGRAGGRKPTGVLYVADTPLADALAVTTGQWNKLDIC